MIDLLGNSVAYAQQSGGLDPTAANSAPTAAATATTTAAQNAATLNHLPHGIRGLAEYPLIVIPNWVVILLALALISAIAWGIWYYWRKKYAKGPVEKCVHPLDRLREEIVVLTPPLPFVGKVQEDYFYNTSMALRRFIEELLKIPASDLTLKELREPLRQSLPLSRERVADVLAFLERADMIKFAQAETTLDEARRCHDDLKLWVAYLMPRVLEEAAAPASDKSTQNSTAFEEVGHRI